MTLLARLIPVKTNIDFIGKRWWGFVISFLITIVTIGLVATKGLNLGIDFSGGVLIEAHSETPFNLSTLREELNQHNFGEITLQNAGSEKEILIRVRADSNDQQKVAGKVRETLLASHIDKNIEFRKVDYVGAQVGREMIEDGALALLISLAGMMIYLWFRFEWQFGIGGIVALFHDAVATIGFFAITQLEFNLTSVAAVLTIIGYSINDSVVIYDRIRENLRKYKKMAIPDVINLSVNETLSRTILTGSTVVLSLIGLIFFGGDALQGFSLAMLFGVFIGTYSSVYISAPILLYTGVKRDIFEQQEQKEQSSV